MKFPTMAIPPTALLLVLSVPTAGRPQTDPQATSKAAAANSAQPNLTEEQLGDLYMARKDYREAIATYTQLAGKNPRNPTHLNKLGMAYQQLNLFGPAARSYERAVKADPAYADAMNNLGTVWYQRKKYGKAIREYRRAIAIRPDMAVLYSNLGYAYFGQKKYEEAITSFRQVLLIDPQFFERGTSRTASLMQDRSVEDRGHFYFLLAKSFAQAGNTERCLHYLRKARDEGYKSFDSVKSDPAFAAVLANPEAQELLAPRPAENPHP